PARTPSGRLGGSFYRWSSRMRSSGMPEPPRLRDVRRCHVGCMAVGLAIWDDLLTGEQIAYAGDEPARAARVAPIPADLHPPVREALAALGVEQLYEHQAEAWEAAERGEHFVVTTGTASGKTLAF